MLAADPEFLGGFTGAVPLSRPVYGCTGLIVSVWTDDEAANFTEALAGQRAREALALVEPLLPELRRRIDAELEQLVRARLIDPKRPGVLTLVLPAEQLTEGLHWEFGLDADAAGIHVILEEREIVDVWAGE